MIYEEPYNDILFFFSKKIYFTNLHENKLYSFISSINK